MLRTSKYFKLPTFLAPQSHGRITLVVETEMNLFLGKHIITLSSATYIKLDAVVHAKSHHFSLLLSKSFYSHSLCTAPHHPPLHHVWWSWLGLQCCWRQSCSRHSECCWCRWRCYYFFILHHGRSGHGKKRDPITISVLKGADDNEQGHRWLPQCRLTFRGASL
jgi:hypothetical protein